MNAKHPAGPFTVRVSIYSTQPGPAFLCDKGQIYSSRHSSPVAAARRLACIIAQRTKFADDVNRRIPMLCAGRYIIEAGDGTKRSLVEHRLTFCR